jgi:hypothetical protein
MRLRPPSNEENKKIKIQVYVPPKYFTKLGSESEKYGITVSELVRMIVRNHYQKDATN